MKKIVSLLIVLCLFVGLMTGCGIAGIDSSFKDFKGNLVGLGYTIDCFDNFGNLVTKANGDKISVKANYVYTYNSGSEEKVPTMTSAVTINIDSNQIISCGDTLVFYEDGIEPIYNFKVSEINSSSEDWTDATLFTGMVNSIKNFMGKSMVIVIKSQTGYPIYAFAGDDVYWEIPDDLPKMTCLNIDGKRVYIHRANYQIIDTGLLT